MQSKTSQSRQRKGQSPKPRAEAGIHIQKSLTFRFTDDSGAEFAHLRIDERQLSLLKRVAAATGLTWEELFGFILDRQFEAFFPSGDSDVFSIRENATSEISTGLEKAERTTTALRVVAEEMTARLHAFAEKQPLPTRGFLAELPSLSSLIQRLCVSADIEISDAHTHWRLSARPALLESPVAPPFVEGPRPGLTKEAA